MPILVGRAPGLQEALSAAPTMPISVGCAPGLQEALSAAPTMPISVGHAPGLQEALSTAPTMPISVGRAPGQGEPARRRLRLFRTSRVKKLTPRLQMEGLRATSKVIV